MNNQSPFKYPEAQRSRRIGAEARGRLTRLVGAAACRFKDVFVFCAATENGRHRKTCLNGHVFEPNRKGSCFRRQQCLASVRNAGEEGCFHNLLEK